MKAYSEDLRQRIVHAVLGGMSQPEAARVYQVGERTVKRDLHPWRTTRSLACSPPPGRPLTIPPAQYPQVLAQLRAAADATLAAPCATWEAATGGRISRSQWCRVERRVGWTRKKRR